MEAKKDVFAKSRAVQDMHHLRLMSLLQELDRDHGRKKAAALLGVDRRTLDASLDEGVLSRRMRGVLDKALQYGMGSAATEQRDRNDKLEDRLGELEGVVGELGTEMRANHRAGEDRDRAIRDEVAQGFRKLERTLGERRTAGDSGGEAKANGAGPQPGKTSTLRREFPDLVTLEPAPDDEEVFGEAWPLIVAWRELKAAHPNEGGTPVLADDRGAVPGVGADLVGGARADPSPGDLSAAGLRPERPGQLAQGSALRHAEGAAKAGASSVGQARPDARTVAEVTGTGALRVFVNFCEHFGGGVFRDLTAGLSMR